MKIRSLLWIIGLLILCISLVILIWGIWPAVDVRQILPIKPSDLRLPTPQSFYALQLGFG